MKFVEAIRKVRTPPVWTAPSWLNNSYMCQRVHCCMDVAIIAHVKLTTKLKNQRVFTRTAYAGRENGGGVIIKVIIVEGLVG